MNSSDLIISPGTPQNVDVPSDLDSIGRGNGTPIDGHRVVLTVDESEINPKRGGE